MQDVVTESLGICLGNACGPSRTRGHVPFVSFASPGLELALPVLHDLLSLPLFGPSGVGGEGSQWQWWWWW